MYPIVMGDLWLRYDDMPAAIIYGNWPSYQERLENGDCEE